MGGERHWSWELDSLFVGHVTGAPDVFATPPYSLPGVPEAQAADVLQFRELTEVNRARRVVLQRQVVRGGVAQEGHVRDAVPREIEAVEGEAAEDARR